MQTMKARATSLALVGACMLFGCVEARDTAEQGKSAFISGRPSGSFDYGASGTGGAGGVSTGGTGGVAGTTAGTGIVPPNPMAGVGGNAGTAGTGGMGGDGASGAGGASGIGGAGGSTGGAAGMEASGGTSGDGGTGSATPGTLTLEFMSVGNDGEYAPRNVGAVWIETSSGTFVKTIERWAGIRAGHLTTWTAASGGWGGGFFFATGNTADQTDAISSATLRPHQMHNPTWNMKDTMGMVVPDGTYRVMIEVTESERIASTVASVEFEKGPAPVSLSPADEGPFKDLTLSYAP